MLCYLLLGVSLKQWSGVKIPTPTQPHTSSPSPQPSPLLSASETPDLNSTLNVSSQQMNLDSQQCSQRRCSGNGHCVGINGDTVCVCSLGYRGEFCQNHLLKTMQVPIVYGAAGLCAGVVVIAVMAVLVKRKKSANMRLF